MLRRAVFFDRDGVINRLVFNAKRGAFDSPYSVSEFRFFPNLRRSLKIIRKLGFFAIIVSNQPGIAKAIVTQGQFDDLDTWFKKELKRRGVFFDGIYYCFHHPQAKRKRYRKFCSCRKPNTGLLKRAARKMRICLDASYLIGDRWIDVLAGKRAGCMTIVVGKPLVSKTKPDFYCDDLLNSAKLIQRIEKEKSNGDIHR